MGKHKNLIIFIIITLIRSIFLGMLKIFLRSILKEDGRTLEEIAGYISLGLIFSYFIGGALTYTFRKKPIMIIVGLVIICCLVFGFFTDYFPFKNFTILLSIIGFFYGLWLTIKGIITTVEILESGRSETIINSIINIAILVGILIGSYLGFNTYKRMGNIGFIIIAGLIFLSTTLTLFLSYDKEFKKHTIYSAVTKNIPNIWAATQRYFRLLIPIGIFWAVAMALGQKILEIRIDMLQGSSIKGLIIVIISMIGGIIGLILSNFIKKNKTLSTVIITILFGILISGLPAFAIHYNSFILINIYTLLLGLFIGIIINLVESRFYHIIGDDHRKEFGSAAYGIITSISMFLIMIGGNMISKYLGINYCFVFFGITTILCIPFIIKTRNIIH